MFPKKSTGVKYILKAFLLLFSVTILYGNTASAQSTTTTGVVKDASGSPLPGVNITVVGSTRGAISDLDGKFKITAVPGKDSLEISYVGYKKTTVLAEENMEVPLEEEYSVLNEIVVMGYSERRRTEISGSVVTLKSSEINNSFTNGISDMISGKVAGILVQDASGQPGQTGDMRFRGVGSLFSQQQPLIVVDGVIGASYNPNDVESITVLKDAGAAGLYGSQAAAGVIVITTKNASQNKSRITASVTRGIKEPVVGNFQVMNSQELYNYHKLIYPSAVFSTVRPKSLLNQDFNWISHSFKPADVLTAYVSATGSNEKSKYFLSLDYQKDNGTLLHTNYERFSLRSNTSYEFSNRLSVTSNITGNYSTSQYPHWTLSEGAFRLMPWDNPYDNTGKLVYDIKKAGWYSNVPNNPFHSLEYNKYDNKGVAFSGIFSLIYKITPWLKFDSKSSLGGSYGKYEEIESPLSFEGAAVGGRIYNSINFDRSIGNTSLLKFDKYFGNSCFNGLFGVEGGKYVTEFGLGGTGTGILPGQEVLGVAGSIEKAVGDKAELSSISVISQLNYDYSKKYFLTLSLRRDGSSKFSPNKKYGNFFTAAASWLLSNEQFIKNISAINLLKIRTSYGAIGNETFPDNDYYPYFPAFTGDQKYNGQAAYYPTNPGNLNLSWETSNPFNLGVDLGLFNRVELNLDYYYNHISGLLFKDPLPSSQGLDFQWKNVGEIMNAGVELSINSTVIQKSDFTLQINVNYSTNNNKLLKLSEKPGIDNIKISASTFRQILEIDKPAFTWYMPKWLGVNPDDGKPEWEKILYDSITGKAIGSEKTSNYSEATFQSLGNPFPDFMGGFGAVASWKGITLSASFSYVYGNEIYNATRQALDNDGANMNINAFKLQDGMSRWKKPGDIATHPQPKLGGNNNAHEYSSRYLEDGSYLRLRNLTIAYNLPSKMLKWIHCESARVNFSSDNLFTWTKFTGMDPDVPIYYSAWSLPGVSSFKYPINKNYIFGIEITF